MKIRLLIIISSILLFVYLGISFCNTWVITEDDIYTAED